MATALITGATSGIGREIAWQLAAERMNLILVARSADRLEEVAEHIRQVADVEVEVLPADLSQAEGTLRVCERLIDDERPVGLLVNNAGFGLGQDFVGGDIERELNALNTVGYKELFAYFDGIIDRAEAVRLIQRNSRHYARKQLSWWQRDPSIHWLDASAPDLLESVLALLEAPIVPLD